MRKTKQKDLNDLLLFFKYKILLEFSLDLYVEILYTVLVDVVTNFGWLILKF